MGPLRGPRCKVPDGRQIESRTGKANVDYGDRARERESACGVYGTEYFVVNGNTFVRQR